MKNGSKVMAKRTAHTSNDMRHRIKAKIRQNVQKYDKAILEIQDLSIYKMIHGILEIQDLKFTHAFK